MGTLGASGVTGSGGLIGAAKLLDGDVAGGDVAGGDVAGGDVAGGDIGVIFRQLPPQAPPYTGKPKSRPTSHLPCGHTRSFAHQSPCKR
jgi:hypothetical protein